MNKAAEESVGEKDAPALTSMEIQRSVLPEPNVLLVEQAVDAWLFFNLGDFKNYEPITRSTVYDSIAGTYIHHLRYRCMNDNGGLVTYERDFEVDPNRHGENDIPYAINPL